jgi:hypothetical protein
MSSISAKRDTQIDFRAIGSPKLPGPPLLNRPAVEKNLSRRIRTVPFTGKAESAAHPRNVDPTSGLRKYTLVEAAKSNIRPHQYMQYIYDSPWKFYEKEYQLRIGSKDFVTVAERKDLSDKAVIKTEDPYSHLVLIKTISGLGSADKLNMLQHIHHINLVSALQTYEFEGNFHVVFEYMAIPLSNVVNNPCLNEIRLASILSQVRLATVISKLVLIIADTRWSCTS